MNREMAVLKLSTAWYRHDGGLLNRAPCRLAFGPPAGILVRRAAHGGERTQDKMINVTIHQGDLTAWRVDAIVNAANSDLILGGGLAGAIARRGGPGIQQECTAHGPIEIGQAAMTGAGDLPAKHVIHQASMGIGVLTTDRSLQESTAAALRLADQNGLKSVAFPATGTGVAGFDMRRCAEIMLGEVKAFRRSAHSVTDVHFVLLDAAAREIFEEVADGLFGQS